MSVVQRCPNCGTAAATAGECEACHEAQVRPFCTNHAPGLWLDGDTCPECGARVGELAPSPSSSAAAAAPAVIARERPPPRPRASSSAPPRSYARTAPPRALRDEWRGRERLPPTAEEGRGAGASRMAPWQRLLRAAVSARYTFPRAVPDRDGYPIARAAGGCLIRLVLLIVFLFLTVVGGLFLFGHALL